MNQPTVRYRPRPRLRDRINPRKLLVQLLVMGCFAALVFGPLIYFGWPGERARWMAADAMNLYVAGETDQAIARLREAVDASDESPQLLLDLATLLEMEGQNEEAYLLAELVNAKEPGKLALDVKSNCEKSLGRYKQALATLKSSYKHMDQSEIQSSSRKNNLAYFRALADQEIEQAASDASMVLQAYSENNYWNLPHKISLQTESVISIAQVAKHLKRTTEALFLLNQQIAELRQDCFRVEQTMTREFDEEIKRDAPPSRRWERNTIDPIREVLETNRFELAMLLTVRALIADDMDEQVLCDRDRQAISELGFTSEELAAALPPSPYYLQTLRAAAAYLDTNGVVLLRSGQPQSALEDLDLACQASRFNLLALDSSLQNSSNEQADFDPNLARKAFAKTYAANLYHRMLARQSLHDLKGEKVVLADQPWNRGDAKTIRELGFDPYGTFN